MKFTNLDDGLQALVERIDNGGQVCYATRLRDLDADLWLNSVVINRAPENAIAHGYRLAGAAVPKVLPPFDPDAEIMVMPVWTVLFDQMLV
jgi:hypothetical protein